MDLMYGKEAARVVNAYIEREMSEYRKVTEKDIRTGGIAPEARAAFSRKPYYDGCALNIKNRPVLR
ncbi:MAG: hypothetical protein K1W30_04640 [Lachnospiraceae bacterium]